MISNQDPDYRKWINHRSDVEIEKDSIRRIMNRIAAFESERAASKNEWTAWINGVFETGIVRFSLASGLLAVGLIRLATVSGLIFP
jgi:hypothetical protein